ncbi:hypothetical protein [Paracoccus yeei]|uniref:hypothetical protein n=1 Tax=Paracoccus yeei TaxID=147645 RepID=UPI003BF8DA21
MARLGSKIAALDGLLAALRAEVPPNRLASLTPRARAAVRAYKAGTSPEDRYRDVMEGRGPFLLLADPDAGLPASCSVLDAAQEWQNLVEQLAEWQIRRQIYERLIK